MDFQEPAPDIQLALHRRIRHGDPTAFAELCELALPHLVSFLTTHYPHADNHSCETVAIDLLLNYHGRPEQYDQERLSLFAYLRMAAKYDMLNLIEKRRRHQQKLLPLEEYQDVAVAEADRNSYQKAETLEAWIGNYTDLKASEVIQEALRQFEGQEREILLLMLEGKRETAVYSEVLGISTLSVEDQQREVKRTKDRIQKRLKRLGRRLKRGNY